MPFSSYVTNALGPIVTKDTALYMDAVYRLSTGKKAPAADPVSTAMGNTLGAQAAVLEVSVSNAAQGAAVVNIPLSATHELKDLNKKMQEICMQAMNGSSTSQERMLLQKSMDDLVASSKNLINSCDFGGKPLFRGGVPQQVAFPVAPDRLTIMGLGPTGGFVNTLALNFESVGMIKGPAQTVTVVPHTSTSANVDASLSIGTEVYEGKNLKLDANEKWYLRSAGGSILTLQISDTDISDAAAAENDLKTALGLTGGTPAVFVPGSTHNQNANITINLSPQASPGIYGMGIEEVKTTHVLTLSVSNGTTGDLVNLNSTNPGETVELPHLPGISITFNGNVPDTAANFLFEVRNDLKLGFQTGIDPTDQTSVSIPKTTQTSLHLVDMDVSTPEAAARTAQKAKESLNVLTYNEAILGIGQQSLITAGRQAETQQENIKAARATYVDTNPIEDIEDLQKATQSLDRAMMGLALTLATNAKMASMIQQGFRIISS